MKKILLTQILSFIAFVTLAQNTTGKSALPSISFKGKITYERKLNTHKQLDEMMKGRPGGSNNSFAENIKKQVPKYKTDIFELLFNTTETLYKPAPDGISESKMMMGNIPADRNIILKNLETKKAISQKTIFEKTYLVQDSLINFNWKIKEEFRTIAGFNCRRAETIIMDSVYVIAFYTDAIVASSGPESFNGLPGMILGIVLPRMNVTYFATKVDNFLTQEKEIVAPTKGDKKTNEEVHQSLVKNMTSWGEFLQKILWFVNI